MRKKVSKGRKMAKFKHNKKRNSAFLYEVLIQELTKAVLQKNQDLQNKTTALIKESFGGNSNLYLELKLYRAITNTEGVGVITAEKIINEVKVRHKDIDKKKLLSEQNKLIRQMKKIFSDDIFSNFVPNYKNMASIAQIFNQKTSIRSKILLENEMVGKMSLKEDKEQMVPIDNIVYKSFVKKFNNEYSVKLMTEQRILLNKFITSFHNNGLELKIYLNEEIGRLKKVLSQALKTEEFIKDSEMNTSAKNVIGLLESYKDKSPDKKMVEEVIKVQELVKEIREHDH